MPQSANFIVHPALGGLDQTTASTLLGIKNPEALVLATNIEYDLSGARRKRLGTALYNSSAVSEAGSAITFTRLSDFWRYGTSRTPTQIFVATGGTGIWKDAGTGTWTNIKTGWGTNSSVNCITIAQGYAVFSTSNGTDAPQIYDQTTLSALGGTPPTFSFSTYHLRRLWVAGAAANMSRVSFSAAGDIATWSGADSSNLVFDEDDGDSVVGLSRPWHGRLYVFKGPSFGSVHEVGGRTFSTFTSDRIIEGAPCVGHNTIITTTNDIYWCSPYGFHSLSATQKYGDTEEAFLSRPVQDSFRSINFARVNQIQGFWHPMRNIIGWIAPKDGATQNNVVFVYNYVNNQWATWEYSGFSPSTVMTARDPNTSVQLPRLYLGDYSGQVHSGDQVTQNDHDGTVAYTATIRTPVFSRFSETDTELSEKSLESLTTFFRPKGSYNATLDVVTDTRSQAGLSVSMQGAGAVLNSFVLNTDTLGANDFTYTETPFEERARTLQLTYSMGGNNQDMEILGYAARYTPGETHAFERS